MAKNQLREGRKGPKPALRLGALLLVAATAGCLHLGSQGRGDPDRALDSRLEPPPAPPNPQAAYRASYAGAYDVTERRLRGQPAYVVRVALDGVRPALIFSGGGASPGRRPEAFDRLRERAGRGVVCSGAFFGERTFQTLGTLISEGRVCQDRTGDRLGTALEILPGGQAALQTLRLDSTRPQASFYLQAGPCLVRNGVVWLHPRFEGFADPSLLEPARRVAIGLLHRGRELLLVAFPEPVPLLTEARAMHDLGCRQAMNLDGGSSAALAVGARVLLEPTTDLTHVMVLRPYR